MLHADHPEIRPLLLLGNFGLEKESLRIDEHGHMAHTPHPFPENHHIVRDFCENQTEINTPVVSSAKDAVSLLCAYDQEIRGTLYHLPSREYLWPFSNPPYIHSEDDIPIALFTGADAHKTDYRRYLADRYGRYRMTLSGIHVNYSFSEELLKKDFALSEEAQYAAYKNKLYVALARQAAIYGWLLIAVTAASPLLDCSFFEKKTYDTDTFTGMASVRCSELGYWNAFSPIFDYTSLATYTDSIQTYVDDGLLRFPSELYYPIRLKPPGANTLSNLKKRGADHIELRMFDLNPLSPGGIEEKDVVFAQLFLVYLASMPCRDLPKKAQIQAVQNFKNAAHYDLKTVKIVLPDGMVSTVADAARHVIGQMREFYRDFPCPVQEVLDFQDAKFVDAESRYAWKIRRKFRGGFVKNGLEFVKENTARDFA